MNRSRLQALLVAGTLVATLFASASPALACGNYKQVGETLWVYYGAGQPLFEQPHDVACLSLVAAEPAFDTGPASTTVLESRDGRFPDTISTSNLYCYRGLFCIWVGAGASVAGGEQTYYVSVCYIDNYKDICVPDDL